MKLTLAPLALSAALVLSACGDTDESAGMNMTGDAVVPGSGTGIAEGPADTPTLGPPDQATFASAFAEACPDQQTVSNSLCRAQGMGATDFNCEYGLGEDEYLRYDAVLSQVDGAYAIADPAAVCPQGS